MKKEAFLFLILIFLVSCTIEKRLYNKGYHVEFNRGVRAKTNEHLAEKQETVDNKVLTEVTPKARVSNKTMEVPALQLDTIQPDVSANVPIELIADAERNTRAEDVYASKRYHSLRQQTHVVNVSPQTAQRPQVVKNETKRSLTTSKMTRSEVGSKILNYLILVLIIGLIVLGIAIPEVGIILLTLLVIGLIALIVWLFLEICNFFIDLLDFSWL